MFDNMDDIKAFSDELISVMKMINENELDKELVNWRNEFFTTSSERLGEFRNILLRLLEIRGLEETTKTKINKCIEKINQAFNNS